MDKGAFHRYLGIKEGEPIPLNRAESALRSGSKHVRKMAQFAANMIRAARGKKRGGK